MPLPPIVVDSSLRHPLSPFRPAFPLAFIGLLLMNFFRTFGAVFSGGTSRAELFAAYSAYLFREGSLTLGRDDM
jgi:hypothetical protein